MSLLQSFLNKIKNNYPALPNTITHYAAHAYPSNHTYTIARSGLHAKRKLKKRYKVFSRLYPKQLTSLIDIGCSKGYFVFAAAQQPQFERGLGIDITEHDVNFCQEVKSYLGEEKVQFALLKLDELANHIQQFGGSFQTILIINIYQYLYFGSDRFAHAYLDHDLIFNYLNIICHDRIIFNNRISLDDCQNQIWIERAREKKINYSPEKIKTAASRYFTVEEHGKYGGYPLWVFKK